MSLGSSLPKSKNSTILITGIVVQKFIKKIYWRKKENVKIKATKRPTTNKKKSRTEKANKAIKDHFDNIGTLINLNLIFISLHYIL